MKVDLALIKNVFKPLTKTILIPLVLKAAASAADTGIHTKKIEWVATLVISNEEMEDIMNIGKSLGESALLIKGAGETIENIIKK